jgi:hypothetical protein
MAKGYWVDLHTEDGMHLGAGFHITRRFLLTAEHCLQRLQPDQRAVVMIQEDGAKARGEVCERKQAVDLALIRRVDGDLPLSPPPADRCAPGDLWRTPYRPNPSDPHLNGVVDEPNTQFECVGGGILDALQLRSELDLGSFSGYSGSAVEKPGDHPALVGVLQEQYFDRYDGQRATNVLFAVTMHAALEQFAGYFDRATKTPTPSVSLVDVEEVLAAHTAVLEQAMDWMARGLMSPTEVQMIQVDIARSVVDSTVKRVLQ